MSRRSAAPVRNILPDPLFKEIEITKFINHVMKDGKKAVAERIVYGALNIVAVKSKGKGKKEDGEESAGSTASGTSIWDSSELRKIAVETLAKALENIMPSVEVKSRRVGGSNYQVPIEIRDTRRKALSKRWLVSYAQQRGEKSMPERLAGEILDAANKRGGAFKKMEDVHRMADANKAFIHYRW
ncbi:MAG: 30S ribosomal protein S7 [Pseudomonadota bacterium]|nr:30S ribosomal protein S7 [Pseudomonadota bacterium]